MTRADSQLPKKYFTISALAKQVERKMILDILQQLAEGGFALRDYKYTGLGSIYFVDFMLLHRLLGLRKLLSVEIAASGNVVLDSTNPSEMLTSRSSAIGDVLQVSTETYTTSFGWITTTDSRLRICRI